jgi:beta-galactosidase
MRWLRHAVLSVSVLFTCTPAKVGATKLPSVQLENGWFVRNGKRFIPVGAHWVPAKAAMRWPVEWDPADVEADFAKMHELGYTLVRFDLLWAWLEPRAGEYDAEAFKKLDHLIALAHKYEIYLHPSLFIGGEVGEAYWDVPWRNGRNPHTDPKMLELEARHAAELAKRYGTEPAILAWDLTDEPPFWITTGLTDTQAIHWTSTIASAIREHDKMHPIVVGTSGQETSHGPFRADNLARVRDVGFLSVHPFTIYRPELFPDALLSERSTYGAAFDIALANGAGRPAMVHEMGASSAQYAPERIAMYERANLYSALAAGSIGVNLWCYSDAAPAERKKLPYLRTPQETEWGMVTWDRKDKPRAREFRAFSKVVAQLDLSGIVPATAEAAIPMPDEWAKVSGELASLGITGKEPIPYVSTEDTTPSTTKIESGNAWLMGSALSSFILARRTGLKADFPREKGDWEKRAIVLLPSPLTSTSTPFLTHVHTDFYERAKRYVEQGGVLYASVAADAAVPDMDALFGARLADTNTATAVTIKIVKRFGGLEPNATFQLTAPAANARHWGSLLEVSRGETIAVDQDGNPAVVSSTLGAGKTLLVAFPLETWLAATPSAFDKSGTELADALYRGLFEMSGVKPAFRSDSPAVETTVLRGADRGYLVLVNHGPKPKHVTATSSLGLRAMKRIMPDGVSSIPLEEGKRFSLDLAPWDAAILDFR